MPGDGPEDIVDGGEFVDDSDIEDPESDVTIPDPFDEE